VNAEKAKEKLMIHGSPVANSHDWHRCFIGQLKPYRGRLDDGVYLDIIECLKQVFEEIQQSNQIDTRIVAGVHGIVHLGRAWILDPDSGLRQSGRMPEEEVFRLAGWLENISKTFHHMVWYQSDKEYVFDTYAKIS